MKLTQNLSNLNKAAAKCISSEWYKDLKCSLQVDGNPDFSKSGFDKHGRPLCYMKPRYENSKDGNRQIKNIVFNLELAALLVPENVHTMNIIVDFRDASSGNTPGVGMAKQFLDILGNH